MFEKAYSCLRLSRSSFLEVHSQCRPAFDNCITPASMDVGSPIQREPEEGFTDMYRTHSQTTDTTANDIDLRQYPLSWKTIRIYLSASIGGLLFGYDGGAIAGVLVALKPGDLGLETLEDYQKGVITATAAFGSFCGSISAFPLADRLGRKKTLGFSSLLFIIAAIVMASAVHFPVLLSGRLTLGFAVGIAAQCVPVYLSEVSPSSARGTILTLNTLAITGGQLFASTLSWFIIDKPYAWRILFALSAVPAGILLILLDTIPESPRWLFLTNQPHQARESLTIIYPMASELEILNKMVKMVRDLSKLRAIQRETQPLINRDRPLFKRFSTSLDYENYLREIAYSSRVSDVPHPHLKHKMDPRTRRALIVGCILMFFQQATGFNAFVYYSPVVFSRINVNDPLLPAIAIAGINFIFTGIAMRVVDKSGRRTILLNTIWIMTVALATSCTGFQYSSSALFLTSLLVYVAAYATGMGAVPWMSVEFLPLNQRSFGASCITCTNWLTNATISVLFLPLINKFGDKPTMLSFALMTALNWLFVYSWYPEVKGLSLEEIGQVFENGIDVDYVYRKYH
ncbi:LANO_0H21528g1_1 [Lachancea nothofagi CBS 11611]|uniref:LANO_0H21528g1_1 n=1 Tax=Lachancea nothofagi CBS 11611 TaxID=1266666 RepID=A0A1G4KND9_9SACH|nr:LANO_0H21528g1_1 [Lachancea nothofagi CBS 11611]